MRLILLLLLLPILSWAQPKVLVIEIRNEIDTRMTRAVKLGLEHADSQKADYVIIDMDTYGGLLTDAEAIRTMLLDYHKPVFVFINKNAASAGALISIACDSIYMAKGGSIGAATVVSGSDGSKMPDKYQSYMRGMMRATAESQGRDPKIAEKMVDENIDLPGISPKGQVITFSTEEAVKHNYCDGVVSSVEDILKLNNLQGAQVERYALSSVERIIAFFINPAISGFLILFIIGGLYYEMQHPGIGFALLVSVVAALLYFLPYYLNGLAANWELLAFLTGIALIAVEVFVLPGFGVVGILGAVLTFLGLVLVMLNNDWFNFDYVPAKNLTQAVVVAILALVGSLGLIIFGLANLTKSRFYKEVALKDTMSANEGFVVGADVPALVGKEGRAYTVLRPSGKIIIDGNLYDAQARNQFIEKDSTVVVVHQDGMSIKVVAKA